MALREKDFDIVRRAQQRAQEIDQEQEDRIPASVIVKEAEHKLIGYRDRCIEERQKLTAQIEALVKMRDWWSEQQKVIDNFLSGDQLDKEDDFV